MTYEPTSKNQAGTNVLRLEPRIMSPDRRRIIAGREHSQRVLRREPLAADDGPAAGNVRIRHNPLERLPLIRWQSLRGDSHVGRTKSP